MAPSTSTLPAQDAHYTPPLQQLQTPCEAACKAASQHEAAIGGRGRHSPPQPASRSVKSTQPTLQRMSSREGSSGHKGARGAPWPGPAPRAGANTHVNRRAMHGGRMQGGAASHDGRTHPPGQSGAVAAALHRGAPSRRVRLRSASAEQTSAAACDLRAGRTLKRTAGGCSPRVRGHIPPIVSAHVGRVLPRCRALLLAGLSSRCCAGALSEGPHNTTCSFVLFKGARCDPFIAYS